MEEKKEQGEIRLIGKEEQKNLKKKILQKFEKWRHKYKKEHEALICTRKKKKQKNNCRFRATGRK